MPTNAIGTGTANFNINIPLGEREILGRAAYAAASKSVGDFIRRLVLRGLELENPEAAQRVREIRKQYYGAAMLLVLSAALINGETFVRCRRSERVEERMEEAA